MTEGIIQQILKKYPQHYSAYIEQELIENIKQEIQTLWLEFDCDSRTARKILQSLIGDNQE